MKNAGINITIFEDNGKERGVNTPDSIFPNNWISFENPKMFSNIADADKKIFTYPLYAQNRRDEVRDDILDFFVKNMDNCN